MEIEKANLKHLAEVARLFDLYRQFYGCPGDLSLATRFIQERIENNESDIFVAVGGGNAQGFVQLYPSFCSVDAVKIYILYDLYVDERYRELGVGEGLMNTAIRWAKENGAARVDLLTAHSNSAGQRLYEKLGYRKVNEEFYAYSLTIRTTV